MGGEGEEGVGNKLVGRGKGGVEEVLDWERIGTSTYVRVWWGRKERGI